MSVTDIWLGGQNYSILNKYPILFSHKGEAVKKTTRWLFLINFSVVLMGCDNDIHNHPANTTGKELFEIHCSNCHGASGSGKFLKGVPNNRNTDLGSHQIVHKIKQGNGGMPAFPNMPTDEAKKIVSYLRSIKYSETSEG